MDVFFPTAQNDMCYQSSSQTNEICLFGWLFSVFTPYYSEDVIYSIEKLTKPNDDGISIIYYLSTIVPGLCYSLVPDYPMFLQDFTLGV